MERCKPSAGALGDQTPSEFATQFEAQRELTSLQEAENSP
jgi:hypothetical protein